MNQHKVVKGLWFFTMQHNMPAWKGRVLDYERDGFYLVELVDDPRSPSPPHHLVHISAMPAWSFYPSERAMRAAYAERYLTWQFAASRRQRSKEVQQVLRRVV